MKIKKFESLIFEAFKDSDNYDIIKYGLMKARSLMLKHQSFSNSSAQSQFDMCTTIYLISTQSSTKAICSLKIIATRSNEKFAYALDEGFEQPQIIEIQQIKQ